MAEVENNSGMPVHSTESIWSRVNEQQKSIGEIQANVASLTQRVEGGFSAVMAAIDRIDKPTDTKGWLGLAITVVMTLGAIGLLVITPIQKQQEVFEQRQWKTSHEVAFEKGYHQATRDRAREQ